MILGLGIIWVYLRRYRARRPEAEESVPAAEAVPEGRAARLARIEEELKGHRS